MNILVHACCGPCSIMPTRLIAEEGHDLTVFYANSNIAPRSEYEKRLEELKRYAAAQHFDVVEGTYDPSEWERQVAPIGESIKQFSPAFGQAFAAKHVGGNDEDAVQPTLMQDNGVDAACPAPASGKKPIADIQSVAELLDDDRRRERCRACYRMRLEEAAIAAAQGGYDALATTLAVSPYQFTDVIHEELERAAAKAGVSVHFQDYRPYYEEATRISRELGMYRQNYCGCRFSIKEGEATRAFVKEKRKLEKAAKAAERAQAEQQRLAHKAEKQAYAKAQARKRAILKSLRESNPAE